MGSFLETLIDPKLFLEYQIVDQEIYPHGQRRHTYLALCTDPEVIGSSCFSI